MPTFEVSSISLILCGICIILFTSKLLSLVLRVFGQPAVVAEMIAGILLGPSVLGLLWPEAARALFPGTAVAGLQLLSQLGLVLFMFLVGLELDLAAFRGRTSAVVFISHVSIVVPFLFGAAAGWWLWPRYASPGGSPLAFMLFLGVAMSVTAFPVLARILVENGLSASPVGRLAMACAAIDDVTAWCLLAFVVTISRARNPLEALWTAALAACFCALLRYAVRPVLVRVGKFVEDRGDLTPGVMAATLMLIIACSVATELIGIHALFGAFVLGLVVPKHGALATGLVEKLETVTVVLLLPLFFAYSGLRTQIGRLNQPEQWWVTLAVIVIATLGKAGAGALATRSMGFAWREARAMGVLMNTRGLVELVVLNAGMDLGIISPTVFTMLVIMALVTTFATTPLLRRLYPQPESRLRGLLGAAELRAGVQSP